MLLECLLILCHKRVIRERLRIKKVYPILRNLDYLQDNEEISALIYEVVSQLIGNEDPSNPITLESESNTTTTITTTTTTITTTIITTSNESDIDLSNSENHLEDVD